MDYDKRRNSDWSGSVGDKGDVFHLIYDDAQPEATNRLLPVGNRYDVSVNVDNSRNKTRASNSECERLFGIVPARFTKTSQNGVSKSFVRVAAIIPGTEAYRSKMNLNDWLMCVNDLEVTWDNIDSILSAISTPKQIRLTLQQMVPDSKKVLLTRQQTSEPNIVRPILRPGETISSPDTDLDNRLTVMYLTLDSNEESSTNDLLYCYPSESKDSNKLVAVRGMFLTLSNVMADISSHPAKISSVRCEGELMHVCYTSNGRQLLIVAATAEKITPEQLTHVMVNSTRCLEYLFSSLHSALSDRENVQRVDLYFTLLSQLLLSTPTDSTLQTYYIRSSLERSYDSLSLSPVCMQLPEEAKTNVDNVLSEFEAADFGDMSDDFYDMRRAYSVMGTCLFYKGYLVANHLPADDMLDMAVYASHYNILAVSRLSPLGSSVVWQEVFPTRRKQPQQAKDPFYVEVHGRYFLLVVAHKHSVLGVLLEAGGCAAKAMGHPVADTFYVNQARQTLRQLESFDFTLVCEARLQLPRPPLNCIDNLQQAGTKTNPPSAIAKGIFAKAGNTAADLMKRAGGTSKLKSKHSSDQLLAASAGFMATLDRPGDADTQSYGSGGSPPPGSEAFIRSRNMSVASTGSADSNASTNQLYNSTRGRSGTRIIANTEQNLSQKIDTISEISSISSQTKQSSFVLTSGEDNTLFNYVSFDSVLGVVLSPGVDELQTFESEDNKLLQESFYTTCLSIRCLFQESLDSMDPQSSAVHEHGVMFTLPSSGKKSNGYWVIGRCYLEPTRREFYVCHHESVAENMVDLAFKVNTGVLL